MKSFFDLVIERGVIGLAIGFILAQLILRTVSIVLDFLIFPLISLLTGGKGFGILNLTIGSATFAFGDLIIQGISIFATLLVIKYLLVKLKTENKTV